MMIVPTKNMITQLFFHFSNQANNQEIVMADFNYDVMTFLFTKHQWLSNFLCIYGESGVGKTLVSNHFIKINQGKKIDMFHIAHMEDIEKLVQQYKVLLFDNFEAQLNENNEIHLFNLYNIIQISNCKLIVIAQKSLQEIKTKLPDLSSRLNSITALRISSPEDKALQQIFVKILSDKQMSISKEVVDYIFKRIQRDMPTLIKLANKMEKYVLQTKKSINMKSIAYILSIE